MDTEENVNEAAAQDEGQNPTAGAESQEAAADPTAEWKNRVAYLSAEIENMRKRFVREKADFFRFSNEELLKGMLPILDNLHLAVKAAKDAEAKEGSAAGHLGKKLLEGVEMTAKIFEQTLERSGVQAVPALGKAFDPQLHEAIAQHEDGTKGDGEVISEMQRGYTLHGRLLRPAKVVVNKLPPAAAGGPKA